MPFLFLSLLQAELQMEEVWLQLLCWEQMEFRWEPFLFPQKNLLSVKHINRKY